MAFDPDLGGRPYTSQYVAGQGRAPGDRRPNIVLIMSDEHHAGLMGCAGHNTIQTRNLDALARSGVMFENCYCNSPLCVPSRASFTSGKYVSGNKVWNNFCMLERSAPSLPRVLNAAGYESFLCGKMHYDRSSRYGFKELWRNLNGDYQTGEGGRRNPADLDSALGNYPDWKEDFGLAESSCIMRQGQRVTNGTLDFLSKRNPDDKPFFLLVGYEAPHYPIIIPQSYYERYKGRVAPADVPPGVLESLALNYKHMRRVYRSDTLTREFLTYITELYYAMTDWFDDEMGRVLAALSQSPFSDNTLVIYTSDHGESMGEHGMIWKGSMFEHSARVPLIVSYPQRWRGGQTRKGACSLLDVVRTVADIAQANVPADWNGTPLSAWIDDPQAKWKDLAVSEYYAQQIASGYAMLRTGQWKYVYHTRASAAYGPERELYDLDADPRELKNLARDPAREELMRSLHSMLVKEVGEDPELTEARARADLARTYNRGPCTIEVTREPLWQGD